MVRKKDKDKNLVLAKKLEKEQDMNYSNALKRLYADNYKKQTEKNVVKGSFLSYRPTFACC